RAVDVDLVQVEPVFVVAAHGEEDFLAIVRRLGLEHRSRLEVGQAGQLAIGPGRDQGIQVPAGTNGAHRSLAAMERGAARIDVAITPVVTALIDAFAAVGLLIENGSTDEDDTRKLLCGGRLPVWFSREGARSVRWGGAQTP